VNSPLKDLRGRWGRLPERGRAWLAPLGWLYGLGAAINGARMASGAIRCVKPVVSIGNLEVGGTGKTPATLALARLLVEAGRMPGIVTGLWGAATDKPWITSEDPEFGSQAPDEARLYARRLAGVPVISAGRKARGAQRLDGDPDCDIILVDDGLQHRGLERNLDLVLLSDADILRATSILPAGPLREFPGALSRADHLLMEEGKRAPEGLEERTFRYRLENATLFDLDDVEVGPEEGGYVLASAIARPERFEAAASAYCEREGLRVCERVRFRDHEEWSERVAGALREALDRHPGSILLITEKDARRWAPFVGFDHDPPRYLGLELIFERPENLMAVLDRAALV